MTAPETALRLRAPIHQNSKSYRSKHTGSGLRDLPTTTRSVLRLQGLLVHVLLVKSHGGNHWERTFQMSGKRDITDLVAAM